MCAALSHPAVEMKIGQAVPVSLQRCGRDQHSSPRQVSDTRSSILSIRNVCLTYELETVLREPILVEKRKPLAENGVEHVSVVF